MGNTEAEKVVCFHCGQPVVDDGPNGGPRLNEIEEGVPCTACADRLLAQLPPIFHTPWSDEPVEIELRRDYPEEDSFDEGA
jgi:hypothetical protein